MDRHLCRFAHVAVVIFLCTNLCVRAEGNLSPTAQDLAAGEQLVAHIKVAFEMKSLMPKDVRDHLGFGVVFETREELNTEEIKAKKWVFRVENSTSALWPMPNAIYKISAGYLSGNGASFYMPISDKVACISGEVLKEKLGNSFEVGRSTMRHYLPGEKPPSGILPYHLSWTYRTPADLLVTFGFDYVCASEVSIYQLKPTDWTPTREQVFQP